MSSDGKNLDNLLIKLKKEVIDKRVILGLNRAAHLLKSNLTKNISKSRTRRAIIKGTYVKKAQCIGGKIQSFVVLDNALSHGIFWIHERDKDITIKPKVKKYLFIPLTAAGRRHETYRHDAKQLGLKGIIPKADSDKKHAIPVGQWDKNDDRELDYVLKKSVNLKAHPDAKFLYRTKDKMKNELIKIIEDTVTGKI